MTVKYHKKNTNFQIEHFLMKAAHTPDNMYFQLIELLEDRNRALDTHKVSKLRVEAKKVKAIDNKNKALQSGDKALELEAEADLVEIENELKYETDLYNATMDEHAFICRKIDEIKPLCKYVGKDGIDDIKAHEMSQSDAWKCELLLRAENMLLMTGTIAPDHFMTMRLHPAFEAEILPHIQAMLPPDQAKMLGKVAGTLLKLE